MSKPIAVGTVVRVVKLPDLASMPEETQAAFRAAIGSSFRVLGHGPYGHLELELGREIDTLLGGFMNTIWVEPDLVEVVEA